MPTRRLPADPNLEQLRNQAKTLQRQVRNGDTNALALVHEFHPRHSAPIETFARADAQLVLARSYGFASWPALHAALTVIDRFSRSPHRVPVASTAASTQERADQLLLLGCLTYSHDDPDRLEGARRMLAEHPELSSHSIYTASAVGDVAAARRHLRANPDLANRQGGPHRWEPLLYLAYSRIDSTVPGHSTLEVARLLLDSGADPNAGFLWEGLVSPFTVLTGAFGRGEGSPPPHQYSQELAQLLLDAGADPNDSQTLYNCGLTDEGDDYLRLLLRHGLGRGDGGVWHRRLGHIHPTPAQLLQDELLKATRDNLLGRIRLLVEHGADVDGTGTAHPNFEGHTAWEVAILGGNTAAADLLGAHPAPDPVFEFLGACMRADHDAVQRLRTADPSLPARAIADRPQHIITAAAHGRTDAVCLMAGLGFDVNHVTRATALHEAAYRGHLSTVRALIALGADHTRTDPAYQATPLGWAQHGNRRAVAEYLTTVGENHAPG